VNYFGFISTALSYAFSTLKQMKLMRSFLRPIVNASLEKVNYTLSSKEKKKIDFYYPLFNQIVNIENYLCLKGRYAGSEESKRMAIISAMATLYDDLIDEEHFEKEQYHAIVDKTIAIEYITPKINLIFELDNQLRKIWTPSSEFINALKLAIEWQVVSKQQLNSSISLDDILSISEKKCGNSSLLWASVLDEKWNHEEKLFIYQSGVVGQLVNDLFDAFKDREDGVYTFVSKVDSINKAKEIFIAACMKLNQAIVYTKGTSTNKEKTIQRLACIHSFGLVALENLEHTNKKYGMPWDISKASRAELITDMAFIKNKLKLFNYTFFLAKL
jgi:hypothetical protein